ncbi:hypothetical protein BCR37DRAFT_71687 [Protomyces lactucae-debilis]|uniref:Cyclic nucleotide-binding domain-containing protein n=1 Tax=Protomyces lactucae-debilis TaxID=2754530 RepID=A0A1Y2F9D7_PROLT|nr:uncharacterized protein BCR37DRAFT_71687 [Protomyces lactucae-debilis]ORY80518.1 hypothetical protein BCR37DRAFT_71687 [Protomyces lactucae-debilis]
MPRTNGRGRHPQSPLSQSPVVFPDTSPEATEISRYNTSTVSDSLTSQPISITTAIQREKRQSDASVLPKINTSNLSPSPPGTAEDGTRNGQRKSALQELDSPGSARGATLDVTNAVRSFKLFHNAPEELIELILNRMRSRMVEPGDEICKEGEEAKAMYWIIRGTVAVVSRDGESKFAELHAGQFFGEIGVLFSCARTASILAQTKCLLMALTLEDLQQVLPRFPNIERAIREEAQERLELTRKLKYSAKRGEATSLRERILAVPMFADLPPDILHFLGLKIKPANFAPFTPILVQDMPGREIYFIVSGSVEVIDAARAKVLARLGPGQFFGELAWLSLSDVRTASVRSVTAVEALVLEDGILQEVSKVYPSMRKLIEAVAQDRLAMDNLIMSKTQVPEQASIGSGTLATVADQDPFGVPSLKRKLSIIEAPISPRQTPRDVLPLKRQRKRSREDEDVLIPQPHIAGRLPERVVMHVIKQMTIARAAKLRLLHSTWNALLLRMPMPELFLGDVSRTIDDAKLRQVAAFIGSRAEHVNISHCSLITDSSFKRIVAACGPQTRSFALASCWNVSPLSLFELTARAPNLRSLDLSNCRKMNDQALFKIINTAYQLEELDLGYCKHISDRSMHCIAVHASPRLRVLKLSRCTSITDAGFGYWSYAPTGFPKMTTLILRDCTFLSDNAIVALVNSCGALQHLDLSFCCALSDTSVEVLSLGLPNLKSLLLAFCGSAVSDSSLGSISHHLQSLRHLSVRGCVRVTEQGVRSVLDNITTLEILDVSQCRNLPRTPSKSGVEITHGG